MLWNIIDHRSRPYRWKRIKAIIEGTDHDNSCADADQAPKPLWQDAVVYDERVGISLAEAVAWATSQKSPVTLFLYDDENEISN